MSRFTVKIVCVSLISRDLTVIQVRHRETGKFLFQGTRQEWQAIESVL